MTKQEWRANAARIVMEEHQLRRHITVAAVAAVLMAFGGACGGEDPPPGPVHPVVYNGVVWPATIFDPPEEALILINTDGSDKRSYNFHRSENIWCPRFSPDRSLIAFGQGAVFLVAIDNFSPQPLAEGLEVAAKVFENAGCPTWSSDGSRVAVTSLDGSLRAYDIVSAETTPVGKDGYLEFYGIPGEDNYYFRVEETRETLTRIFPPSRAVLNIHPEFPRGLSDVAISNDGLRAVFVGRLAGNAEDIFVSNLDLHEGLVDVAQLTDDGRPKYDPDWCSADDQIVFTRRARTEKGDRDERVAGDIEFVVVNVDGTAETVLDTMVAIDPGNRGWIDCN